MFSKKQQGSAPRPERQEREESAPRAEERPAPRPEPRPEPRPAPRSSAPSSKSAPHADCVLAEGTKFSGEAEIQGTLRVEGAVEGAIAATDTIVLGKTGQMDAEITAKRALLGGTMTGKIEAKDRVELQSGSRVEADIVATSMTMEEGVSYRGHCRIGE